MGYNPPRPMSNDTSMQEFQDYQLAMKLQQEQLYKAAQGKRAKKAVAQHVYAQNKNAIKAVNNRLSISSAQSDKKIQMHQQQIILDQQQSLLRKQYEKMNAVNRQRM